MLHEVKMDRTITSICGFAPNEWKNAKLTELHRFEPVIWVTMSGRLNIQFQHTSKCRFKISGRKLREKLIKLSCKEKKTIILQPWYQSTCVSQHSQLWNSGFHLGSFTICMALLKEQYRRIMEKTSSLVTPTLSLCQETWNGHQTGMSVQIKQCVVKNVCTFALL